MDIEQGIILSFELVGLNKIITITDYNFIDSLTQNLNHNETANGRLFQIIENYLNKRYQVQAIKRKYIPIFLFKQGDFKGALKHPQRIKDHDKVTSYEGYNNTPFYFLVYIN